MSKSTAGLVFAATIIPGIVFKGLALSVLWAWFVTRLGIREITTAEAIGLYVLVYLIAPSRPSKRTEAATDEDRANAVGIYLGNAFINPILAILIGWLVKAFI